MFCHLKVGAGFGFWHVGLVGFFPTLFSRLDLLEILRWYSLVFWSYLKEMVGLQPNSCTVGLKIWREWYSSRVTINSWVPLTIYSGPGSASTRAQALHYIAHVMSRIWVKFPPAWEFQQAQDLFVKQDQLRKTFMFKKALKCVLTFGLIEKTLVYVQSSAHA